MRCDVCGQEYGMSHNCPGPIPAAADPQNPVPEGFALFHYLGEGWRIVRWDDVAIRRVMDDARALPYGILIWVLANTIPFLTLVYLNAKRPATLSPVHVAAVLGVILLYAAILWLVQMGVVHLVAKYFCAGDGKFIQIMRPLLLASMVFILQVIPIAGVLISGLAMVCVMVMVFDEVDGMPQLTAFLVSAAAGFGLRLLTGSVFSMPF